MNESLEIIGIDHIYISVSDLQKSESFYDKTLVQTLGFRKNSFELDGESHIQYFNRHFGYVLRPAHSVASQDAYTPGLHHLCLRVDSPEQVAAASKRLQSLGISASEAQLYTQYASDYWASFFSDPDGLRLEITNYREERRERYEHWNEEQTEETNGSAFAQTPEPPYYAVIFSARQTANDRGYGETAEKMLKLASQQPGFLSIEGASNPDGFGITVSYWTSAEAIAAWKANAEHMAAQTLGREIWYEHYELRVAKVERAYDKARMIDGVIS